jgi:hypothetical protein
VTEIERPEKQKRVLKEPGKGGPLLGALGTLVAGIVVAIILFALGFSFLGYVAGAAGVLGAFAVWIMLATRL